MKSANLLLGAGLAVSLVASFAVAGSAQAEQFVTNGNFLQLTNGPGNLESAHASTSAKGWSTAGYNFVDTVDPTVNGQQGMELWDHDNVTADNTYNHISNGPTNSWNGSAPGQTGTYSASTQNFAVLEGDYGTVYPLTQTITGLTIGDTYTLKFDYAFGQQKGYVGSTSQSLEVNLGDAGSLTYAANPANGNDPYWAFPNTPTFSSGTVVLASEGFSGWMTVSKKMTATSTSEVLSFLADSSPSIPPFALVTGVSLTDGVPEPASWSMMIIGVGAIGALARRRRQVLATA